MKILSPRIFSWRLIVAYLLAFALIPAITRNIIPYDMIENLYWGKELQLGYAKHPPLFAWVSYFFYKFCFSCPESLYFLTQLNLALGFYFIFKISQLIFKNETQFHAAILIFMASVDAVFGNEKFNATTILMSLLPAMFYYFIRLLKFNKYSDAIMLGIFAALAFGGKYFALLYVGCMGLFLIFDRECWKFFKTPQIYVAAATFLLCVSWHVVWICENDFATLKYALKKISPQSRFTAFNFLVMQCLFFATSFWAFMYSCVRKMRFLPEKWKAYSKEEKFVLFITIVPSALLFFASLSARMRIGSFWGANMLMTIGIYLLIINKDLDFNFDRLLIFVKKISIFFAIVLFLKLGVARNLLKEYDPTNAIDIRKISRQIDADWRDKFGDEKMKILKTDKAVAALHIHLKDSPSSYDPKRRDLFRVYDLYPTNENVVVAFLYRKNDGEVDRFRKLYGNAILFENEIRVINDFFVYYAFVSAVEAHERH
jgi:hypothetical protein